jgi:hypothetical protein
MHRNPPWLGTVLQTARQQHNAGTSWPTRHHSCYRCAAYAPDVVASLRYLKKYIMFACPVRCICARHCPYPCTNRSAELTSCRGTLTVCCVAFNDAFNSTWEQNEQNRPSLLQEFLTGDRCQDRAEPPCFVVYCMSRMERSATATQKSSPVIESL